MIEISTPIQAQTSLDNVQEKPPDVSVFGKNTQKGNKLGVFAKLLEGLTVKTSLKSPNINGKNEVGGDLANEKLKKDKDSTFSQLKSGKKTGKSGEIQQNLQMTEAKEPVFNDLTGFFNQFNTVFEVPTEEFAENAAGFVQYGENAGYRKPSMEDSIAGLSGKIAEGETENSINSFGSDSAELLAFSDSLSEEISGEKNRGAVDFSLSARNMEAYEHQFIGEKRPALVDQLAGFSSRNFIENGESKENLRGLDSRSRRTRERAKLEVFDQRTFSGNSSASGGSEGGKISHGAFLPGEKVDAVIKAEFRPNVSPQENTNGGAVKTGFEQALVSELQDHLSSDIVRQASILLKNGGEGVIRLSLKPESLGNVKIRVEMTENKITGHIIVESREAFKAFERELPVLEKQFQDSGFSEASLDMSFAWEGGNFGTQSGDEFLEFLKFSQLAAASGYEAGAMAQTAPDVFGTPLEAGVSARTGINILV